MQAIAAAVILSTIHSGDNCIKLRCYAFCRLVLFSRGSIKTLGLMQACAASVADQLDGWHNARLARYGGVAERLNAAVLKTAEGATLP